MEKCFSSSMKKLDADIQVTSKTTSALSATAGVAVSKLKNRQVTAGLRKTVDQHLKKPENKASKTKAAAAALDVKGKAERSNSAASSSSSNAGAASTSKESVASSSAPKTMADRLRIKTVIANEQKKIKQEQLAAAEKTEKELSMPGMSSLNE